MPQRPSSAVVEANAHKIQRSGSSFPLTFNNPRLVLRAPGPAKTRCAPPGFVGMRGVWSNDFGMRDR